MDDFTHIDESGAARMVDVGGKSVTDRFARASSRIRLLPATLERIQAGQLEKGDVFQVARLAGIMAAKRTSDVIPLCHPLSLNSVQVSLEIIAEDRLEITSEVRTTAKTGVEMEALTAVSVAALTIYDMCKSVDREMIIEQVQLDEKSGGRSGDFRRPQ